jgi:uncharacterized protein YndB with AHSA1/START domain
VGEGARPSQAPDGLLGLGQRRDGLPGDVVVETLTLETLGAGRTRVVTRSPFPTTEERDGRRQSGMEQGRHQRYAALDRLLATRA